MPYVDLVNEVLEFYVVNNDLTSQAAKNTAGQAAAELDLQPQHLDDDAYAQLRDAAHGTLPFHLPLETTRAPRDEPPRADEPAARPVRPR